MWVALVALAIGVVKARFLLDRAARQIIERIRDRGDGRCLGGFLSLRTWGLAVVMMGGGGLLRSALARAVIGPLYLAAGTALVLAARLMWRACEQSRLDLLHKS
jgi:uncharacterized membrane protein